MDHKQKRSNQSAVSGVLALSVSNAVFLVAGYVTSVFVARILGPPSYGLYSLLIALFTALNTIQINGIPQALSRIVASKPSQAGQYLGGSVFLQSCLSLFLFILFNILAHSLAVVFHDPVIEGYVRMLSLVFPIYGFYVSLSAFWNGTHNFKRQALGVIAYSIGKMSLILTLSLKLSLFGAVMGFVIAPVAGLLAVLYRMKTPSKSQLLELTNYSFPLIGYVFCLSLMMSLDLFALKALGLDPVLIGHYSVALNLAQVIYFAMGAFGQVMFPVAARLIHKEQKKELSNLITSFWRYIMGLSLPIAAIIGGAAPHVIKFVFGTQYVGATNALRLLLFAYVIITLFAMLANVLNGSGRAAQTAKLAFVGVLINLGSILVLTPLLGLNGAAIGTCIGSMAALIMVVRSVKSFLTFDLQIDSILRIGAASIFIGFIAYIIPIGGLILPLWLGVLFLLYLLFLFLLGEVTVNDKVLILKLFRGNTNVDAQK